MGEQIATLNTPTGAELLAAIGKLNLKRGDLEGAQERFQQAHEILCAKGVHATVQRAQLLKDMGKLHQSRGNYSEAVDIFHQTLSIHESMGTLNTPECAGLLKTIGELKLE